MEEAPCVFNIPPVSSHMNNTAANSLSLRKVAPMQYTAKLEINGFKRKLCVLMQITFRIETTQHAT
jgi:hypothetical protein